MSDQPSAPPPQPRPRPRPRPAQRPAPSKESKFVGYLVLGFGILAVVAVLLLAFMGRGPDTDVARPDPVKAQAIITEPQNLIQKPKPVPAQPAYKAPFKRQPDMNAAAMDGNWQAMIGRYVAVLQMNEGVYQIVYGSDDPRMPRHYSSGTYTVQEDMITLTPRMDWPKPLSRDGGGNYRSLTTAPFSLVSAFYEDKMLWANIPPGEIRVRRTVESPLFLYEDTDYVVWERIP